MILEMRQIIEQICDYFGDEEDLVALYLYGSFAQGQITTRSDVDVALLWAAGRRPDFRKRLADQVELSERLGRDVDLVDLNGASPILRMQVLKKGRLLLNRDPSAVNAFFVRTVNEYFDLKQCRREIERNLHKVAIYD